MNGTEVLLLSERLQSVTWKPSIPKEKHQRSLRSMEETDDVTRQKKKDKLEKDEQPVQQKPNLIYTPALTIR